MESAAPIAHSLVHANALTQARGSSLYAETLFGTLSKSIGEEHQNVKRAIEIARRESEEASGARDAIRNLEASLSLSVDRMAQMEDAVRRAEKIARDAQLGEEKAMRRIAEPEFSYDRIAKALNSASSREAVEFAALKRSASDVYDFLVSLLRQMMRFGVPLVRLPFDLLVLAEMEWGPFEFGAADPHKTKIVRESAVFQDTPEFFIMLRVGYACLFRGNTFTFMPPCDSMQLRRIPVMPQSILALEVSPNGNSPGYTRKYLSAQSTFPLLMFVDENFCLVSPLTFAHQVAIQNSVPEEKECFPFRLLDITNLVLRGADKTPAGLDFAIDTSSAYGTVVGLVFVSDGVLWIAKKVTIAYGADGRASYSPVGHESYSAMQLLEGGDKNLMMTVFGVPTNVKEQEQSFTTDFLEEVVLEGVPGHGIELRAKKMQTETRQPLQVFCEQLNGKRDQLFSLSVFAKTIVQEMLQVSSLYVSDSSQVEFGQFAAGMFDEKSILPELKAKLQRPFDAETSHSTNSHLPQGASFTDIPKEHSNPNQRGQLVIVPDQNDLRVATSSVLQKTEQRFEEFLEVLSSLDDLTPEELDFNDEFTKESLTRAYLTVCAIKKLCPKIAPPVIKNSKFANNFKLEFPEIAADCEQQVQQISSEGLPDQEEFL